MCLWMEIKKCCLMGLGLFYWYKIMKLVCSKNFIFIFSVYVLVYIFVKYKYGNVSLWEKLVI